MTVHCYMNIIATTLHYDHEPYGMKFSSTVIINAPPETVWSLVYQLDQWHHWMPSIKGIQILSSEPLGKGSKLLVRAKVGVFTLNLHMTIIDYTHECRVIMKSRMLGTTLIRFYLMEPIGDTTRVTIGGEVSGPLAWLARHSGQAISEEIAQSAKVKLESL